MMFLNNELVSKKMMECKDIDWINNQVKECRRVSFDDKIWLICRDMDANQYFFLCESDLDLEILATLRCYHPLDTSQVSQASHQQLMSNLEIRLTELRSEKKELQQEIHAYQIKFHEQSNLNLRSPRQQDLELKVVE